MKQFEIAAIPGDGVGKEVVAAAEKVLHTAAEVHGGLSFSFTAFPWSCDYYLEHGKMMPEDGIHTLTQFEAVFGSRRKSEAGSRSYIVMGTAAENPEGA